MKKVVLRRLFFFNLMFLPIYLGAQSGWSLATDKDDIKIYTRSVSGSSFKEFKAEMTVRASLSALVELLDDVENQVNWIHNCAEARRLRTISRTEGINYTVIKAPWPVTDRDLIIRYKITQDEKTKEVKIEMTGDKSYIAEKRGLVRVPSMAGTWLYTPVGRGLVKITYQVHSETGGFVPASIANAFVVDAPYYTFINMREELKKPKYKNASVEGVIEP